MSGFQFFVGAALGAALVASVYSDPFRNGCKQAINGLGNEINKQAATIYNEFVGIRKEESSNGQSRNAGQVLPDQGCSNGLSARPEHTH